MVIDKEKEILDLPDHNLMLIRLMKEGLAKKTVDKGNEVEYYEKDDGLFQAFVWEIEEECNKEESMDIQKL